MNNRQSCSARSAVVSIIGGSIWGNRGAAAMLETTVGRLREFLPQALFNIFTPYPERDRILVGDERLHFFDGSSKALVYYVLCALWHWMISKMGIKVKLPRTLQVIAESDVMLEMGGITFSDGRLIYLPYNIMTIWPAMLLGTPLVKMSQSIGPCRSSIIRRCAKTFLPHCQHIFTRGEKTLFFLRELGLEENKMTPAIDIAFLYHSEYCLSVENRTALAQVCRRLEVLKKRGIKIIAIAPSVLVMKKSTSNNIDYNRMLLNMIEQANSPDIYFVVFPSASRSRCRKTHNNDIQTIEQMRAEAELSLPPFLYERIIWMSYELSTQGIEAVVQRADVLVTSRFHAMVCGLRSVIPIVVISWGHKYLEVMKCFSLENYVFDFRESNHNLSLAVREMLMHKSEIQAKIEEALSAIVCSSNVQFEYLKSFLHEARTNS